MTTIPITDKYILEHDGTCWTLLQVRVVSDAARVKDKSRIGETYRTPIGYWATLKAALPRVLDRIVSESDAKSVSELKSVVEDARDMVLAALKDGPMAGEEV